MKRIQIFIVILTVLVHSWRPSRPCARRPPTRSSFTMFWGDGCPHCAEAKPFLADLTKRYPQVELTHV